MFLDVVALIEWCCHIIPVLILHQCCNISKTLFCAPLPRRIDVLMLPEEESWPQKPSPRYVWERGHGEEKAPSSKMRSSESLIHYFFLKFDGRFACKNTMFLSTARFYEFLAGKMLFSDPFHFSLAFKMYTFALLVLQSGNVLKKYGWGIGSEHRLWTFDLATMLEV